MRSRSSTSTSIYPATSADFSEGIASSARGIVCFARRKPEQGHCSAIKVAKRSFALRMKAFVFSLISTCSFLFYLTRIQIVYSYMDIYSLLHCGFRLQVTPSLHCTYIYFFVNIMKRPLECIIAKCKYMTWFFYIFLLRNRSIKAKTYSYSYSIRKKKIKNCL